MQKRFDNRPQVLLKAAMDAAAYNTRFAEEPPFHSLPSEPTTSELEASAARFEGLGITRIEDIPWNESVNKLHLSDSSLFLALDESIFSTSTISASAISTPLDKLNNEPFIVPASDEGHAIQDLPEIRVHDEEHVDAPSDHAAAKAKHHHAKTILRVVKKAGASAKKFAHKTKSLTKRREHKLIADVRHIFDVPAVPHNTPVPDYLANPTESAESFETAEPLESAGSEEPYEEHVPIIPVMSIESLAATLGSPTTLAGFPLSPPRRTLFRSLSSKTSLKTLNNRSKLQRAFGLLLKIILLLPYALIIGSLPFLAPHHLSAMAFSPVFGYVSRPTIPADRYTHHMKFLPCHIGLALGFLGVLNWDLLHRAPLVFAGLNAALIATTWWVWRDFDAEKLGISTIDSWELGSDDRATVYHLFEATVPHEVRQALQGLTWLRRFPLSRLDEDVEQSLARYKPVQEHVRIIIQYDD